MLIVIALIFWAAYFGFIRILFDMMQDDGAFDIVFKWGSLRDKLYSSGKASYRLIENAIGGCGKCTALWWSLPWGLLFGATCSHYGVLPDSALVCVVGYILFVCINFSIGYKSLSEHGM